MYAVVIISLPEVMAQESNIPSNYKLVYTQNFTSKAAIKDFEMSDQKAWRHNLTAQSSDLELFGQSEYEARVRSPFNIAMLKSPRVRDFVMEIKLMQTGKEYGHRDLCIFFGAKDATNFYYAHLASKTDDHANNIFLVNDEPRIKISTKTSTGTDWGTTDTWHTLRIERDVDNGQIRVYFNDMASPVMTATDSHFDIGRVGVGSFDDTGKFDEIKIWAPRTFEEREDFFAAQNQN